MEHYDVIIIGTGAGGGTLAHKLAPSGKKILLLERGGYLPREPENWDSREVFRKERYLDDELWYDKDGTAYKPHQQYFVGGNTKFYGAILFRLRERDFQEVQHYGGTSPAWPISYAISSPTTRGREALPRPRRCRRGPERAVAVRPVPVSGRLARAADPAARRRLRAHRPSSVPPAGRHRSQRVRPRGRAVRALQPVRRVPVPDRRQGGRARALRAARAQARQRQADHARQGGAARDRPIRTVGHAGPRRPPRRPRGLQRRYRRGLVRRDQLGRAAAEVRQRQAPARSGELLRRRRPPLHGAHQLRRDRDLADAEHDQVPEDARHQRLLLGRRGLGAAARAHPDARQVRQGHPARRRPLVRAGSRARLHGQARDRLLADDRGPAASGESGHGRPRRSDPRRQDLPQPRAAQAAAGQAQGADGSARLPRRGDPELVDPRPADPARRQRASVRHRAVRQRSGKLGARRQLPGARRRQPVRRRHELLPLEQRREPGADGDGQCACGSAITCSSGSAPRPRSLRQPKGNAKPVEVHA